jgi:hypothetical protein
MGSSYLTAPDDPEQEALWAPYRQWLSRLTPEQLIAQATELSRQLQSQASSSLSGSLEAYHQSIDRPVLVSTRTADPSRPTDRSAPRSPSPQPSSLDLLSASGRLGPKLAARLVASQRRASER